ncbi:MAG: alpha/beta hydrolase [Alphaproteobacteria bacterium]|nr:alpha/beta hydrolase [Alphaproteobacteria bacterium]MBL7097298.1 alpha/beta hydrolase [Alphaproteobacteria bacterium]
MRDYEKLRQERFAAIKDPVLRDFYRRIEEGGMAAATGSFSMTSLEGQMTDSDVVYHDVTVQGPHGPVPTRIFKPKNAGKEPLGIYLHTHGAYSRLKGLDTCTPMNIKIVKDSGCIVVHPDYKPPPEATFPVPLDDCFAAFLWTAENAERIGGKANRICAGGGCVGANLAAAVAIMARDAGGPKLAAQYLYCPVVDMRLDYSSYYENDGPGYVLSYAFCKEVYTRYLGDWEKRFHPLASVLLTETVRGLPTTLIDVGEWDVLRDESIAYANRLRDADVDVTIVIRPEMTHGPTPVHLPLIDAEMARFLRRTVGSGYSGAT